MVCKYITRLNNWQSGFSFIELMVCIMVMIIGGSFLRVSFKFADDISLQYEAVYLVNELRNMQKRSKIISLDNTFYGREKECIDKITIAAASEYFVDNMGKRERHLLSNNIIIHANRHEIFFSGNNSASTTTIYLTKDNSKIKIIIDTVGRIRMVR